MGVRQQLQGKSSFSGIHHTKFSPQGQPRREGHLKMTRVLAVAKKMTRVPIVEAKKVTAKKAVLRVREQLRKYVEGP